MLIFLKKQIIVLPGFLFVLILPFLSHADDLSLFPDTPFLQTGEFTPAVPVISCDSPVFQFSRVIDGTIIHHTFSIKNEGDALLKILKVKTGCGCSTASFDSEISAGKTGNIVLKIDTGGYGGTTYEDEILLETNDPHTPVFKLKSKGPVDSLAMITPKGVSFKGKSSEEHKKVVSIKPNENYNFKITSIDLGKLKDKVKCKLETQKGGYQLFVQNQMEKPGRYWGKLILHTDHPKQKKLNLWVSATLK